MAEFKLPFIGVKKRSIYLKEELRKILKGKEARAIANAKTIVLFSSNTSLEDVERSLLILLSDIKFRKEIKNRAGGIGDREKINKHRCVLCKGEYEGYGNDAEPLKKGYCCDGCNTTKVIPERVRIFLKEFKVLEK